MRITRHEDLAVSLAEEVLRFVDAADRAAEAEALGEVKRAQLAPGADRWTGILARDGDEIVGYAHISWPDREEGAPRAVAEVVVAPGAVDRPAVARAVLDEARAVVAEAGGGRLAVWAHGVTEVGDALPAAAGFEPARVLAVMSAPLGERPAVDQPPEGVELRSYRPGQDDRELLRVNNAAFADHPEQGAWDAGTLATRRRWSWFDPEGVILAWRGQCLLGFHWTKVHADDPPVGEVYVLGVGPDAQGLGLGRVLLRAGLAHLHDRGCREVVLYVDTANSGAVSLYERAGFATRHHEVCYEDEVEASPA